jgi:hypothetical protein
MLEKLMCRRLQMQRLVPTRQAVQPVGADDEKSECLTRFLKRVRISGFADRNSETRSRLLQRVETRFDAL